MSAASVSAAPGLPAIREEDQQRLGFARHLAFIVGIDAYQRVSPLRTAVGDATRLAEILKTQHRFEVVELLLDASAAELRALVAKMQATVRADDRVIVYFAGHGIAADGDDGPAGYIVPADADPSNVASFVPMTEMQEALDALPCRHLLLILDCCFSGAFKWSSKHRAIGSLMPKRIFAERFDRFARDPAWQIITSAAYDQKALDVLQGKPTGDRGLVAGDDGQMHSPFALALFDALAGAADTSTERPGDGVVTATELYAYIRDRIEPATLAAGEKMRQTPSFFPLKKHDKGEFMFLHPRHRLNLPSRPERSPFKGLAAFEEADRDLFYGRERVVVALREKAASGQRLLVVVGASGTGKSSVVKAGLLPKLRSEGRRLLTPIRPGSMPLAELERAVAELKAEPGQGDTAVLVIDQYEELVTRCSDREQRAQFEERLLALLAPGQGLALVLITVRSDFEAQFHESCLKQAWLAGRFSVPPFSLEELREVVVMPTIQEVLVFEPPSLVDEIIQDVVQSPGALPMLSYALSALFERRQGEGRALRKADYDALGGAMGAMAERANTILAQFDPPKQELMRKIMLRMVSVEGELASRRVPKDEIVYEKATGAGEAAAAEVLQRLVDARLVVAAGDYYEPAHDALVRNWPQIRKWIDEMGREKLKLAAQVADSTREYQQRKRHRHYLWHADPRLTDARQAVKSPQSILSLPEVKFVNRSKRHFWYGRFGSSGTLLLAVFGLLIWLLIKAPSPGELRAPAMLSTMALVAGEQAPGSLCVVGHCEAAAARHLDTAMTWHPVVSYTNNVSVRDGNPESRVLAAWSEELGTLEYGGRIVAVAGLDIDAHENATSHPENLLFLDSALRFTSPSIQFVEARRNECDGKFKLLVWPIGQADAPEAMLTLAEARGWQVQKTGAATLKDDLSCTHVLWIVAGSAADTSVKEEHAGVVFEALESGIGLLVVSNGATAGPPGQDSFDAVNVIGKRLGFAFTRDRFSVKAGERLPLSFKH